VFQTTGKWRVILRRTQYIATQSTSLFLLAMGRFVKMDKKIGQKMRTTAKERGFPDVL
jgi:hypothetical protein